MHVLQLTTEYLPRIWGGLGRSVPGLCEELKKTTDLMIIVHDYLFGRTSIEVEQRDGYSIIWTPTIAYDELAKVIDFERVDVVNVQMFFFEELAMRINKPIVYTIRSVEEEDLKMRGVEITPEHIANINMQARLVKAADRLIVCSAAEAKIVASYFPEAAEKLHVIPNGYCPASIEGSASASTLPQGSHDRTILYVGRFSERKGLHVLVEAFAHVWEQLPQSRLVLVGGHSGYDDQEFLHGMMANLPHVVQDRIYYAGWIESGSCLREYYRSADVLAVPSLYEPFGNVVLEGFNYRIPVVASNVGGMAEIIEHGRSGLLVEPDNAQNLAQALMALLQDREQSVRMADYAYTVLLSRYSWTGIAEETVKVYQHAINTSVLNII